ncbi:hypothetical protein FACS189430_00880 [Bacteroidia bacterium]|nr:hypothetical protein FACS189430_00880 [Bacteroidia bacterium]
MKRVSVIILAVITMVSCGGGGTSASKISGSIDAKYQQICVGFFIIPEGGSYFPVTNGKFNFNLPEAVDEKFFGDLKEFMGDFDKDKVTVSDKDAMFARAYFYAIDENYQGRTLNGKFRPMRLQYDEKDSGIIVEYAYFDRDVTITGTDHYRRDYTYNLELKKGWNVVVTQGDFKKVSISTSSISKGVKWEVKEI